jgi:hypothetical protein
VRACRVSNGDFYGARSNVRRNKNDVRAPLRAANAGNIVHIDLIKRPRCGAHGGNDGVLLARGARRENIPDEISFLPYLMCEGYDAKNRCERSPGLTDFSSLAKTDSYI